MRRISLILIGFLANIYFMDLCHSFKSFYKFKLYDRTVNKLNSFDKKILPKIESRFPPIKDNSIEKAAIFSLSFLLSTICPEPIKAFKKIGASYDNFVNVSKLLLQYKTSNEIRLKIVSLISKIIPKFVKDYFRKMYSENPKLVCELSVQWFGFGFLTWLIGPVEPIQNTFSSDDGTTETWNSTVKLLECRYLVASGCKAACTQLCKRPTQYFFSETLGVPLYMKPNFTDYSCEMMFGQSPPPESEDEAFSEPCFSSCSVVTKLSSRNKCIEIENNFF